MTADDIKTIILKGEGLNIEFKGCQNEIGASVYETVCSFLNHSGGCILIGVDDDKEIIGVNKNSQDQMMKNFVHVINNPKLFSPKAYVTPEAVEVDGKSIIIIMVEKSLYVHRYKNRYYDRNNEADSDVTDQPALIANLFSRKDPQSYENRIVPMFDLEDLDSKTFDYCRKLVMVRNDSHPWLKLSNEEILRSCGLVVKDSLTGNVGIKLAALLLFGKDDSIACFLPAYRFEAIYRNMSFNRFTQNRLEDTVRYNDRITVRSNLVKAYDALMSFTYKYLPEKFYIPEGSSQRGDLRSNIFREIVANLCVHRNYASNEAGFYEIFSDRVLTRNVTSLTSSIKNGVISIDELVNYTKNPLLVKVFRELGWGEELGSGSRNIKKFAPVYYDRSEIEIINGETFFFSITYSDAIDTNPTVVNAVTIGADNSVKLGNTDSVNLIGDGVNLVGNSVNSIDDGVNLTPDRTKSTNIDLAVIEKRLLKLLEEIPMSIAKMIKKRMVQEMLFIYQVGELDRNTLLQELEYTSSQMKGDLRVLQQCGLIVYYHKENVYSLTESIIEKLNKPN